MQSKQGSVPTPPEADGQAPVPVDALARRRLLLKGLGKGASAAAVLVPIQTLATVAPTDSVVRLCTVSGVQSNVGSGRTGGTTNQCRGYASSYFASKANWPGYDSLTGKVRFAFNSTTYNQNVAFSTVFGSGVSTGLFSIVSGAGTSSAKVWATAFLNALKRNGGANLGTAGYFPYSATEVVALYNNASKRANAEYLFANYLQTLTG